MNRISYRDSHQDNGDNYASSFVYRRYRSMMWRLEQDVLDMLLAKHVAVSSIKAADFACGTGRVLRYLAPRVDSVIGIDNARTMLDVLRRDAPNNSEIIECDLTVNAAVLKGERFDVITAFRFFPNAEPELRDEAFKVLASLLKPGGVIIFNNHQNSSSPVRILGKFLGLMTATNMTGREVHELVSKHGFVISDEVGLGTLPLHDRFMPLPVSVAMRCERYFSHKDMARVLAQNVVFAAVRGRST